MSSVDPHVLEWRKARRSTGQGACVEFATVGQVVVVRDSKDQNDRILTYSTEEWMSFLGAVKRGYFDILS